MKYTINQYCICFFAVLLMAANLNSPVKKSDIKPQLVRVDGGTFEFGDGVNFPKEPAKVQSFLIGKYEVTQKEWRSIMGKIPKGIPVCDDCPVGKVTLLEATKFLAKLSKKTGAQYRLPTQEEWEFAAKGGILSKNTVYSGSNDETEVGWVNSTANEAHPVGKLPPNELGIFDMTGNVREWTSSHYQGKSTVYYMRGGSFRNSQHLSTNTWRDWLGDRYTDVDIGFRYALDVKL